MRTLSSHEMIINLLEDKIIQGVESDLERRMFWDYAENGDSVFSNTRYEIIMHRLLREVKQRWGE